MTAGTVCAARLTRVGLAMRLMLFSSSLADTNLDGCTVHCVYAAWQVVYSLCLTQRLLQQGLLCNVCLDAYGLSQRACWQCAGVPLAGAALDLHTISCNKAACMCCRTVFAENGATDCVMAGVDRHCYAATPHEISTTLGTILTCVPPFALPLLQCSCTVHMKDSRSADSRACTAFAGWHFLVGPQH
jgi:hypothetical protein